MTTMNDQSTLADFERLLARESTRRGDPVVNLDAPLPGGLRFAHAPGIEGYEVTDDGRVFSLATNWRGYGRRELVQSPDSDGYPSVRFSVGGVRKRLAVHRLVAAAFLGPRPRGLEVRHLDGDKLNNCVTNFAYGTQKENAADRERHGTTSRGESHSEAVRRGGPAEARRRSQADKKGRTHA